MTKARLHKLIRKTHRWLGVFFGIQVLMWTVGGLYFSWTDIKHVKGEDIRKEEPLVIPYNAAVSAADAIKVIKEQDSVLVLQSVQFVAVLDSIYCQVVFHNGSRPCARLVNAVTGNLRPVLTEAEAAAVATSRLKVSGDIKGIDYITQTGGHHEYRNKPLPVYAVHFGGAVNSTVYVSPELGTVQSLRNTQWRIYDILWMLHTMDFKNRSNFNNWLLRFFSAASLLAVLSGFALYFISARRKKKKSIG